MDEIDFDQHRYVDNEGWFLILIKIYNIDW